MVSKRILGALFGSALAASVHAADPQLVVAGRGSSLEQAIAAPHAAEYRLLILRKELNRIRASRAEEDVRQLLERARHDGALVFVCERDLKAERLRAQDLLPGILTVDASDVWVSGAPSAADVRLRALCS
jgi:hypothetical protein